MAVETEKNVSVIKPTPQVPHELAELVQWVVWRYETRKDDPKPTKVPYSPSTGNRAKSTDPTTWGSFTQAVRVWQHRNYDGIGFVFSANDPYMGIDLDGCYNPTTGEMSETASQILFNVGSYAEFSPSGTGIHVFVNATLPVKGRRNDGLGIEMYQSGRFFTVTGKPVADMPETVEERQSIVSSLYQQFFPEPLAAPVASVMPAVPTRLEDRELLDIAMHAMNGPRFSALWRGDTSMHDHNASSADLALCNLLAFYTGDTSRADSLFRQSGLYRPKWDEKRGDTTYGQMTIDAAFRNRIDYYSPRPALRLTSMSTPPRAQAAPYLSSEDVEIAPESEQQRYHFLTDDEQDNMPTPVYLIGGILLDRGINIIYGDSQAGKTFVAIDLSLCVSTDRQWHERHTEHGTVAYIAGEDALGVIMRKRVWKKHFGYSHLDNFYVLPENVPLLDGPHCTALIESMQVLPGQLRLIVIDTLSCAMVGADSDKTKDAVQFMEVIKRLRNAFNCAVLLVHHKNKSGGDLGSSTFRNASDIMLDIARDGDMVTMKCEKVKNAPHFDPIYLTLAPVGDSCVLWPRGGEVDDRGRLPDSCAETLEALKENFPSGATATEWRKAADVSDATFYRHLKALKYAGYINITAGQRGEKYLITPLGRAYSHHSHDTITTR